MTIKSMTAAAIAALIAVPAVAESTMTNDMTTGADLEPMLDFDAQASYTFAEIEEMFPELNAGELNNIDANENGAIDAVEWANIDTAIENPGPLTEQDDSASY
ncbi:MAG: hypothetical protein ACU0BF_00290 [Paracoccaceae bacterium]